jgi:hypothetical protein
MDDKFTTVKTRINNFLNRHDPGYNSLFTILGVESPSAMTGSG